MKKLIICLVLVSILISSPGAVLAQTDDLIEDETVVEEEHKLEPKITAGDFVGVGKKVIFDASETILLEEDVPASYSWNFGDGFKDIGQEVVHQYGKIGTYTVTLTVWQGDKTEQVSKDIFIYFKKALLVTDEDKEEELNQIRDQAREDGVALEILSVVSEEGSFVAEDKLVQAFGELAEYINTSDLLVFYTKSALGLQTFSRYFQDLNAEQKKVIKNKFFVVLTDSNFEVASSFAFQAFKIIEPEFILLSRQEAFGPLFSVKDYQEMTEVLQGRGIEHRVIDEDGGRSPVFLLSYLVTAFLAQGVTASTIYLILIIPFLAFVLGLGLGMNQHQLQFQY